MTGTGLLPILVGRPRLIEFEAGSNPNDRTLNPLRVGSDDIRRWVLRRDPRPIGHWQQLGAEEYARSFTAARTAGADVIDDIYFAFYDVVAAGGTEVDFERLVVPVMKAKGWLADSDEGEVARRLRFIFDTNLRLARSSGTWARYKASKSALPYLRGVTARDDRVRRPPKSEADHTAWDGIILPVDHVFWTRWFPPLGFLCRCDVIQMTRSQLARYRGGITSEAELAEREARLGTPIFASPAAGIDAQLAAMVEKTNAQPTPGRPAVDPVQARRRGGSVWEAMLAEEGFNEIADVIAKLFG